MSVFWRTCCSVGFACLPLTRFFGIRRWLLERRGSSVAKEARVAGGSRVIGRGRLKIGVHSWVGPYALFVTHPDAPITIGAYCDIAPEVCFITGTHEIGIGVRRAGPGVALPICIRDGCWVGVRVTILAGVTIGEGAVVAAGSVVVNDIPPNALVGGAPARVIRMLE